jgi:RNA polymerase sigma factor (TIGR02999 family)
VKSSPGEISLVLRDLQQGKAGAASRLMPLVYSESRRLAAHHMRSEKAGHTLQATALVHEGYLKLVGQQDLDYESRTHFFAIASRSMREVLVEYARKRNAMKRGGLQQKIQLEEALVFHPAQSADLVALDEALHRLEKLDPQQSRIVELRFFGGLSVDETAAVLGISPRTVKRDWSVARVWLHREIARGV